jgi:hypothetical protein
VNTLTITPRLLSSDDDTVQLTVELAPEGSGKPPRTQVLETRNQQPALLTFDDSTPQPPVAWIVTPYLMSKREDLKRAMSCTGADAQAPQP